MTVVIEVKISNEIERSKKEIIESHGRFLYLSDRKVTSTDGAKIKRARHAEQWSVPSRQPSV